MKSQGNNLNNKLPTNKTTTSNNLSGPQPIKYSSDDLSDSPPPSPSSLFFVYSIVAFSPEAHTQKQTTINNSNKKKSSCTIL